MNAENEYAQLIVYPYRRPGAHTESQAVAVDERMARTCGISRPLATRLVDRVREMGR